MIIIEFDWPSDISNELYMNVRKFHDIVEKTDWIEECVAASGGIGGVFNSIWIFRLSNYAMLDKFFDEKNEISQSFALWADSMAKMKISVKEEVMFL